MGFFSKFKRKTEHNENNVKNIESSNVLQVAPLLKDLVLIANVDEIYGERIPEAVKRYKAAYHNNAEENEIQQLFNNLMNLLDKTLLAVPIYYDKEYEFENDKELHFSKGATYKFNVDSIVYRCKQMTTVQVSSLYWNLDSEGSLVIDQDFWDLSRIKGSEGYTVCNSNVPGRVLYPYLFDQGNNQVALMCFTSILELKKKYGKDFNGHIGIFTLREILAIQKDYGDKCLGFFVNPDTESHCFISVNV